jgi:cytochrome c oxidase cbb3-type subunit III
MLRNKKTNRMGKAIALVASLLPLALLAQTEATKAATASTSSDDMMWYSLYAIMGTLLLVIMILGGVLVNSVKLAVDKHNAAGKAVAVMLLLLVTGGLFAQANPAPKPAEATNSLVTNWNAIMAVCVVVTELFVVIVLILRIRSILNSLVPHKEGEKVAYKFPKLMDSFNASVSVEHEKDILLDHNYDGIRELDNNLPPWWKYSFYISIVWAIGYLSYYHVMGGPSSHDEYDIAMKQAKEQQEAYARANAGKVDENTVTMSDAAGIAAGKDVFMINCSPCHGKNGEGVVGPNLTDDYWLHGGSIKDVFKTIKFGWPAKGMKSWSADLSPVQIRDVASYIKSIHGTNPPNGKAPQGDLYSEGGAVKSDSTSQAASKDTVKAKGI